MEEEEGESLETTTRSQPLTLPPPPSPSASLQLQLETDRLEELKLQNLRHVVEAARAELADYWDRCFYSPEQRQAFRPYYEGERGSGVAGWLLLRLLPCP